MWRGAQLALMVSGFSVLFVGMGMGCDQDKQHCEARYARDYEIGACFTGAHTLSAKLQSGATSDVEYSIKRLQNDNARHDELQKRTEYLTRETGPICREVYSEGEREYALCLWGAQNYSILKPDRVYAACKEIYQGQGTKAQVEACAYAAQKVARDREEKLTALEVEMRDLQEPLENKMLDLCWAEAEEMLKHPDDLNANLKKLLGDKASGNVRPEDLVKEDLSKACLDGGMWALAGRI